MAARRAIVLSNKGDTGRAHADGSRRRVLVTPPMDPGIS